MKKTQLHIDDHIWFVSPKAFDNQILRTTIVSITKKSYWVRANGMSGYMGTTKKDLNSLTGYAFSDPIMAAKLFLENNK
jgi:hypothetical protein